MHAVQDFCRQTYPRRELVVVTDGPCQRGELARRISELGRDDIVLEHVPAKSTLGELRNHSLDVAHGEIVCQWDDDDRYHPRRIESQFSRLVESNADVCLLQEQLHYIQPERKLYWSHWGRGWRKASLIPGTLFARKFPEIRYPEAGEDSIRGEDSVLITRLKKLGKKIVGLKHQGHLYLRTYHGQNTWDLTHHMQRIQLGGLKAREISKRKNDLIRELDEYECLDEAISVMGTDRLAFVYVRSDSIRKLAS